MRRPAIHAIPFTLVLAAACGAGLAARAPSGPQEKPAADAAASSERVGPPSVAIDRADATPAELLRDGSVWDSPAWRDGGGHAARSQAQRFERLADGALRLHAGSLFVAQLPGHAFGRLELALDGAVASGKAIVRVESLVRAIPALAQQDALGTATTARLAKQLLERDWAGAGGFASGELAGDPATTWLLVSVEAPADGDVVLRRLHLRELVAADAERHSVGAETRASVPIAAGAVAWFPLPPLRAGARVELALALPEIAAPATSPIVANWELVPPEAASAPHAEFDPRSAGRPIEPSELFVEPVARDAKLGDAKARRWRERSIEVAGDLPAGTQLRVNVGGRPGQALFVTLPRVFAKRDAATPWNLVLVSLDTLRADRVGGARALTPNLDRLARRCVRFTGATSPANFTVPAHASMMTGLQPAVHGADRVDERVSIRAFQNVADRCATAGLATAAFTGGGFVDAAFGFDRGFDRYGMLDPLMTPRNPRYLKGPRRDQPAWNRAVRAGVSLRDATQWVDAHADRRFFLFLHTYHAHDYSPSEATAKARSIALDAPWPAPADLQNEGAGGVAAGSPQLHWYEALYDATVSEVDAAVGELFATLEARGLLDTTAFVITADHGEGFLEHGFLFHATGLNEEVLHVPLLIGAPGIAPRTVDAPVSLVDVAPTLLELGGLEPLKEIQGTSLVPLLRGEELQERPLLAQDCPKSGETHSAIRLGRWKFMRFAATATAPASERLFDLDADPLEQRDRAGDPAAAATLAHARAALDLLLAQTAAAAERAATRRTAAGVGDPDLAAELMNLGYGR